MRDTPPELQDRWDGSLDAASRERLVRRFGPQVEVWCDGVGALAGSVAASWGLRPLERLPAGGTSVVVRCAAADGGPAVLKLTPESRIAADEATALRAWAGETHVVGLLDADPDRGAVLLEHLPDAVPLAGAGWDVADVLPLLAALHGRPAPAGLGILAERVELVFELAGRRTDDTDLLALLTKGRQQARELAGGGPTHLVHGDLHPGNVLRVPGRGVVAIDPRACAGDSTVDLVDWVLVGATDAAEPARRIDQIVAALPAVDPDRLRAWCRAFAGLIAISLLRSDPADASGRFLLRFAG